MRTHVFSGQSHRIFRSKQVQQKSILSRQIESGSIVPLMQGQRLHEGMIFELPRAMEPGPNAMGTGLYTRTFPSLDK